MSTTRLSSPLRRQAIVESALRLFAEHGFRGTTTREIASSVGVSEPILYQHFKTKRDLYDAILNEMASQKHFDFPSLTDLTSALDDRRLLVDLSNAIVNWHKQNSDFTRLLLFGALEGNEFNQLFYERFACDFCQLLEQYFADRIRRGTFRHLDPTVASRTFMWTLAHYSMEVTVFSKLQCAPNFKPLPQQAAVEGLVDIFLKGILA